MKTRVGLVAELPPPPGGMAMQAQRLTAGLRECGHEVVNVATNPLAHSSRWQQLPGLRGALNLALYLGRLPRLRRVDCVHVFSHSYLSFFLFSAPAALAAGIWRKRLVLHYHGGAAGAFLDRWRMLAAPVLRAADRIVVPSAFLVEVFARHGFEAVEVPNTLELERYCHEPRRTPRPHLLVARHLEPVYNVACALRVFARVAERQPAALLTVAGDGSERGALEQLARELGVSHSVRFAGNLDQAAMLELYRAADVLLNTSRVDNQPVSILEAFASGMPVVSTSVGGIPHMVSPGEDALLAADDDDAALAAHVLALVDQPGLAERLAEAAWRRVQRHSWSSVYPLLAAAYGERCA